MDADAHTHAKHAMATLSRPGSSTPTQATHAMPYTHAHALHRHTPRAMSSRIDTSTHMSTHTSTHRCAHHSHEHGCGETTVAASSW